MFCFVFVIEEWAKSQIKKSHIPSKLYKLLFAIIIFRDAIAVYLLEPQTQNFAKRPLSTAPYSVKWFHLKRGDLVMNGYLPCWFLHTISYKQMRLATVKYKDSGLKLFFTFQVLAEVCIFLFSHFCTYCMNVSHATPDNIKHFQQVEPEHYFDYTNWRLKNLHQVTIFLQLVAKRRPKDFLILSPD